MTAQSIQNVTAQNGREETNEASAVREVISWRCLSVWKVQGNVLEEVHEMFWSVDIYFFSHQSMVWEMAKSENIELILSSRVSNRTCLQDLLSVQ